MSEVQKAILKSEMRCFEDILRVVCYKNRDKKSISHPKEQNITLRVNITIQNSESLI